MTQRCPGKKLRFDPERFNKLLLVIFPREVIAVVEEYLLATNIHIHADIQVRCIVVLEGSTFTFIRRLCCGETCVRQKMRRPWALSGIPGHGDCSGPDYRGGSCSSFCDRLGLFFNVCLNKLPLDFLGG